MPAATVARTSADDTRSRSVKSSDPVDSVVASVAKASVSGRFELTCASSHDGK